MDMTEPIGRGFAPSIQIRMHLYILAEPKSWDFSPIQLSLAFWAFPCPQARSGYIARPPVRTYGTPAQLLRRSLAPPQNDRSAYASLSPTRLVDTSRFWLTVVTIPNAKYPRDSPP